MKAIKKRFFADTRWVALVSHWFRRVGFPWLVRLIYAPFRSINAKPWVRVIRQVDWTDQTGSQVIELNDLNWLQLQLTSDQRFPKLYCSVIQDACIRGGSNFVWVEDALLHHDLYDFETDFTCDENYFRVVFDRRFEWALPLYSPRQTKTLPKAAVFTDGCSGNYAHWLTEILPRISVFCMDERFKDVPLLVDAGLHPNIRASLSVVVGSQREIHELTVGQCISVQNLYWMSVAGYVPYERRKSSSKNHGQGVFSPYALGAVRDQCRSAAMKSRPSATGSADLKIYLRRNAGVRLMRNVDDVEKKLVSHGFMVVQPEKLNFLEQVQLLSQAKWVIGPTGAALANFIFAQPGAQLVVLMSDHPDTSYDYWRNIANPLGLNVTCILGAIVNDGRGIHSDFYVDTSALDRVLEGV